MSSVHKIAVLGKDFYILYLAEMAQDCTILQYLLNLEWPKNFRLPDQYFYELPFSSTMRFGKKHALLVIRKRPQDMVLLLPSV